MKYLSEYRNPEIVRSLLRRLETTCTRNWKIMEVCGGQTHSIIKHGIDKLLPDLVQLVHGPGCPVCVTPISIVDAAIELARNENVIFCSFGDMLRVPGSHKDLLSTKADGADIRIVYSPLDAVKIAQQTPDKQVVFFAVGFETTAPANAMAVKQAEMYGLNNFYTLVSQVLIPPAMQLLLNDERCGINGFLAAGHVCSVMGWREYEPMSHKYNVPIVATGFEPVDILQGILMVVEQLESGRAEVNNQYSRAVRPDGNPRAKALLSEVFQVSDREWRGIGIIPDSGLELSESYISFDAVARFGINLESTHESQLIAEQSPCISGQVLQGIKKPGQCPAFGITCTPEHPLGATMVSSEGACAAYYKYRS